MANPTVFDEDGVDYIVVDPPQFPDGDQLDSSEQDVDA
jgi:hypothetical protein